MKYAIIEVPYVCDVFYFTKSTVVTYCDESNVMKTISNLLPHYKTSLIRNDIRLVSTGSSMYMRLCPGSTLFILNIDSKMVTDEFKQKKSYSWYLEILKSIRLNKLKQIE